MDIMSLIPGGKKLAAVQQLSQKYANTKVSDLNAEIMIDIVFTLSGKTLLPEQADYLVAMVREKGIDGVADALNNPLAIQSMVGYVRGLKTQNAPVRPTVRQRLFT